ncbi:DNA cytosine methyltransferase [Methylobacterium brachiatum]|uniref:DNA cytosine methyltransferase n=1 Tax=Methylobacterium brachiatum TaxID=269660 RepID=UPI003315F2AF
MPSTLAQENRMFGAAQLRLPLDADNDFASCETDVGAAPSFSLDGQHIFKHVRRRNGTLATSAVLRTAESGDLAADFDLSWLRSRAISSVKTHGKALRVADLFAGCGAMSLGAREAGRALQLPLDFALAAELDPIKAGVYARNLEPKEMLVGPLENVVDGHPGEPATAAERELVGRVGKIDILLGGPPCQGHSDLNNHTRRNDVRNQLVTRMARFAELFSPAYVILENVQGVRHDRLQVATATATQLAGLNYTVEEILLDCITLGVPQRRRRYMLVAKRGGQLGLNDALAAINLPPRPVSWALADLLELEAEDTFNTSAVHSAENERRIRFLFEQDIYDLPDEERPACHRTKTHSYRSVYGRMSWNQPAQTITTGFGSTGQGRFVHPLRPRTLTPHEAARLQTVPDFFDFGEPGRTQLQKMIGNSVPPLAMAAVATQLLR